VLFQPITKMHAVRLSLAPDDAVPLALAISRDHGRNATKRKTKKKETKKKLEQIPGAVGDVWCASMSPKHQGW
jgi:hypothetical protein